MTDLTRSRPSLPRRAFDRLAQWADHHWGWDKLPTLLAIPVLVGLRDILRRENLFDTYETVDGAPAYDPAHLTARTTDGSYNDLTHPAMGMAGRRFGRNVPPGKGVPETTTLMTPTPREVSRRLMTRESFVPATSLNVLAATWIQFMVKDWFSHGEGDLARAYQLPRAADDPWPADRPLIVPASVPDPTDPRAFINQNTPWWDGSSIYGSSAAEQRLIRAGDGKGAKLNVSPSGFVVLPDDPRVDPSQVPGFWVGLAVMASLFSAEHNAVVDALARAYPRWDGEELFQRARLVVTALIAKIHTLEWTPAIIAHPTTRLAMNANWYGLAGRRIHDAVGRLSRSEVLSGIPGSEADHFGVPYSLTEEFGIVYRMHPLIPDEYAVRRWRDDSPIATHSLRDLSGPSGKELLGHLEMADLLYSFGTANPGAIVLHNYPRFLQEFLRPDGKYTDLAATDILRTREFGVPRYNEFRRLLHLRPARTFADLTDDPKTQETLRSLYGDVEQVDTIVGMFAEKRPEGFGFSDTAFRVFILMASRRLNSDRFFTDYFTPEVYSEVGYRWITENDMTSVLLRHHPQLRSGLAGVGNAFAPWRSAGERPA